MERKPEEFTHTVHVAGIEPDVSGLVNIRSFREHVVLGVSLRLNGDAEICLTPTECDAVIEALQRAIDVAATRRTKR